MAKIYLKKVKGVKESCHDKNDNLCFFIMDRIHNCSNKPSKLSGICDGHCSFAETDPIYWSPSPTKVKIKRLHPDAKIPRYAHDGDAGMDLTCVSKAIEGGNIIYGTGLSFEIPKGFVGLLFPRSSNSKKSLMLTNHVGVLDSGYRGEVLFKYCRIGKETPFANSGNWANAVYLIPNEADHEYVVGDRIGQIIILPFPTIEFEEVEELSETVRGEGGYGSTGR